MLAVHTDPEEFLAAAAPLVAGHGPNWSMVRSWASGFTRAGAGANSKYYLATAHGKAGRGVAVQRDELPVVVFDSDRAAAATFARDLRRRKPRLGGVVGSEAACDAFASVYCARKGIEGRLRVRMRHHCLTAVEEVPVAPGRMREALAADDEWLIARQVDFIVEAKLPDSPDRARIEVPRRRRRGDFRIWEDGERVALAGWSEAGSDAARIAPVHTLPDHRRRGYATALVAALARELMRAGRRELYLMTDLANPTSNAIYERIGFRPAGDAVALDFVGPDSGPR